MQDRNNSYMLVACTAGTLIGLIFVVISLGAEHAKSGNEARTRTSSRLFLFISQVCFDRPRNTGAGPERAPSQYSWCDRSAG